MFVNGAVFVEGWEEDGVRGLSRVRATGSGRADADFYVESDRHPAPLAYLLTEATDYLTSAQY